MTTPSYRRRWPVLIAALLLIAVVAVVARAGPFATVGPPDGGAPVATPTGGSALPTPSTDEERTRDAQNKALARTTSLQWLTLVYVATVVALLAGAVWFGLWWVRDGWRWGIPTRASRGRAAPVTVAPTELAEAVEEALVVVEQGAARDAVVACWLLLERAAARAGSPARPHETAREYAGRLSAEQLVSTQPLTTLAELYREARFSDHEVGPELRLRARRALAVLQAELGSGVRM